MVTSQAFWDKAAAKYDKKTVKGPNYAARIERAAAWIGPDANVLDVGCAGGQITLDLAQHVKSIVGIDLSPKLISYAQARQQEQGIDNADFMVATPDNTQFQPASFDAITAYSLLHLVDDQGQSIRRFSELLSPGGVLILEIPTKQTINLPLRLLIKLMTAIGKAPRVKLYPLDTTRTMLKEAGFEIQETKAYNPKSLAISILSYRC